MSGSGLGSYGFTGSWGVALSVPVQEDESPNLQVLDASSLALWMGDLDSDQESEMETKFLWYKISSENPWLSLVGHFVQRAVAERETQMRIDTCIVCQSHLWLYGHVAHFPDADYAHQIVSVRMEEPHEWRRPMGRPRALWLQQVDKHLKEMGMGQASAWGMERRRPLESRRKWMQ